MGTWDDFTGTLGDLAENAGDLFSLNWMKHERLSSELAKEHAAQLSKIKVWVENGGDLEAMAKQLEASGKATAVNGLADRLGVDPRLLRGVLEGELPQATPADQVKGIAAVIDVLDKSGRLIIDAVGLEKPDRSAGAAQTAELPECEGSFGEIINDVISMKRNSSCKP